MNARKFAEIIYNSYCDMDYIDYMENYDLDIDYLVNVLENFDRHIKEVLKND